MPTTQRQIIAYNPATVPSWGFIFCLQPVRKTAYNTAPKNCLQPAYNLPTIFLRMRVRGCAPVRVCVGVGVCAPVCVRRAPVVRVGACGAFVGQGFCRSSVLMPQIAQIPPVSAFRGCFLVGVFFVGFRGIFRPVSVLACVRGRSGGGFRAPWGFRCRSCRRCRPCGFVQGVAVSVVRVRCRRRFLPCVPFCGQNRLFLAFLGSAWVFGRGKKKRPFSGRFCVWFFWGVFQSVKKAGRGAPCPPWFILYRFL